MRGLSRAGVTGDAYRAAIPASSILGVGVNDALAYATMTGAARANWFYFPLAY